MNNNIMKIFRFLLGILCYLESRISYYQNRRKIFSVVFFYTIFIIYQSGIITVIVSPLVILLLKALQISISSDIYSKAKILNLLIIIFRITLLSNGIIYYPNVLDSKYNPITKIKYFVLSMFSNIYNKKVIYRFLIRFFIIFTLFVIFLYEIANVFTIIIKPNEITTELMKTSLSSVFIFSFLLISIIMIINTRDDYKILRRKIVIYFVNLIIMIIASIKTMQNIIILENQNIQFSNYIQIVSLFVGVIISVSYLKDTFDLLTSKYSKNIFLNEKIIKCYTCNYSCFSFVRLYKNIWLRLSLYLSSIQLKYKKIKNEYLGLNLRRRIGICLFLVSYLFIFAPTIYIILGKGYIDKLVTKLLSKVPQNIEIEILSIGDKFQNGIVELITHAIFILIPVISTTVLINTYNSIIKIVIQSKSIKKTIKNLDNNILRKLIASSYFFMFLSVSFDRYLNNEILTIIINRIGIIILTINTLLFLGCKVIQLLTKKIYNYKEAP